MLLYFKSIPKGYRHYTLYIIHFPFSIIPICATEGSDKSEFGCLQKRKKPPELGALMIARRMPVGISVPKKANDGPSPRVSSSSITARLPTPDPGSAAFSDPSNGSQGLRFTVRLRRLGTVGMFPFRNTVICPVFYHTFRESAMVFIGFYRNSSTIVGNTAISFSTSSSVVSWQREMRTDPSMRVESTPIASNT